MIRFTEGNPSSSVCGSITTHLARGGLSLGSGSLDDRLLDQALLLRTEQADCVERDRRLVAAFDRPRLHLAELAGETGGRSPVPAVIRNRVIVEPHERLLSRDVLARLPWLT